jgi:hypothetical protein
MSVPPFTPAWRPRKRPWQPRSFVEAPALDGELKTAPPVRGEILLINPFYAKDPHASFGKHVLTPTLALTSIAGATPPGWKVRYWDENLLQGPPPSAPFPEVVGITVHLTFARRAYELAGWYRRRGAKVVLGGLHVLSCPEEARPHADIIVVGDGVSVWPQVLNDLRQGRAKPEYKGSYLSPYQDLPAPDRKILPRRSFLTTTSLIYDTAHCVFRPRHMEPEVVEAGYFWCYERLFSHTSIWQRRPEQPSTAMAYLARTYLYKRSNRLWEFLIRHRLVHTVWRPLVEVTRWQRFRSAVRLEQESAPAYCGANLLPARGTVDP